MADLKTNYVDDVLDSSKNQLRKYQQIQNDDGTVSFVDVTEYSTTGTSFGAKDINDTNAAVNELNESLNDYTMLNGVFSVVNTAKTDEYGIICTNFNLANGVPLFVFDGAGNYACTKLHVYNNYLYATMVNTYSNAIAKQTQITLTTYYLPKGR